MAQQPANPAVAQQRQINAAIVALAAAQTAQIWPQVDWAHPAAATAVRTLYGAVVNHFGQSAAAVAAQFYDDQRAEQSVPGAHVAEMADPLPPVMLDKIVTSAFLGGQPASDVPESEQTTSDLPVDQMVPQRLDGQIQRLVLQPGRETIAQNVAKDPAKPRYVRVPTGDKTCAFCVMMASRELQHIQGGKANFSGYNPANVKFDKETQRLHVFAKDGTKYHDHCDCEAAPVYPGQMAADVSPNIGDYQDMYAKAAANVGSHRDTKAILSKMRELHGLK